MEPVLGEKEIEWIQWLWKRKLQQDAQQLPPAERHRNLEPVSAQFVALLVSSVGARRLLEIGGSSGISTIALGAAARATGGKLTSIELEPKRQAGAKKTISALGLNGYVNFVLGDAAEILPTINEMDLVLIDCEKEDYIRFFNMLKLAPGSIVVADNVLSHNLEEYVMHVRGCPGIESITLPIGKGLEISRMA